VSAACDAADDDEVNPHGEALQDWCGIEGLFRRGHFVGSPAFLATRGLVVDPLLGCEAEVRFDERPIVPVVNRGRRELELISEEV
jgi:hypothetical protein